MTALPHVTEAAQSPGAPQAKSESQGENKKQSKRRKEQIILKLIDESKSPIFKITPPPSILFPSDFPRKGKDHSGGLATLPAPLCFPRAAPKGVNITGILHSSAPPGSTVCSAALWHPELFHPCQWHLVSRSCSLPNHKDVTVPRMCSVGRCCNLLGNEELGVKISTSCSKSPEPAGTRPLGFACCLSWVVRSGTFSGSSGPSVPPARCSVTLSDP